MPRIDSEKFYKSALKQHGITALGVCWLSNAHQQIRFDVILDMLPSDLSSFTLADAGCGFGDFHYYLTINSKKIKSYIGIDSVDDMCDIAKQKTDSTILLADITKDKIPSADYYVCSGALNVLTLFETHQFIRNCFESSKKGFIFNVLHGGKESQTYNYLSTAQIEQIAKTLNVKKVLLKDGYQENDITVGFFK
jgi:SAM-dependent methyltransferase